MADKFPYLARQMNGPIADSFGKGFDHVYEGDLEFIEFLSKFSLEELSGEWLDRLGMILGMPRPYYTMPNTMNAFMFDSTEWIIDGDDHGFSTDNPTTRDGKKITRDNGGLLDDVFKDIATAPMIDKDYRRYIAAVCQAKKGFSITNIANIVTSITKSTMFVIDFDSRGGFAGDITVRLPVPLMPYQDAIKTIFDRTFTVAPRIEVEYYAYFFEDYILDRVKNIVTGIIGPDGRYKISYRYEVTVLRVTVTLDTEVEEYQKAVEDALVAEFGEQDDLEFKVVVEEIPVPHVHEFGEWVTVKKATTS